jgi:UDP-N-acetyl-D-mannosaminuronic acid transferase (WecB/TagA/CpsF family)
MANVLDIDDYDLREARAIVTAFGTERFGYIVTPNVDHVIRHYNDPEFRAVYAHAEQAQEIRQRFGLKALHHINPPMNFIRDEAAVESCLQAIEACSPFRFCLLAVGTPQQELIALKLKERGIARGLTLCVGASINFITGVEKRAPRWMQKSGFEWLFRLIRSPKRLANRYLVRGPRIFLLLPRVELRLRRPVTVPVAKQPAPNTQPLTAITGSHSYHIQP